MSESKERLGVYISSDVLDKMRELVKHKYDGSWGLSWEVEAALRSWLKLQTQTQIAHTKMNPRTAGTHIWMDLIIKNLRDAGLELQCSVADLIEAIGKVRGSDKRTVDKWTEILLREKKIKRLNPAVFEIV